MYTVAGILGTVGVVGLWYTMTYLDKSENYGALVYAAGAGLCVLLAIIFALIGYFSA